MSSTETEKLAYSLALKNEVAITVGNIRDIFANKTVFVFGYGSLLFSDGWNGRGMKKATFARHLKECVVNGYKRGTFGIAKVGMAKGLGQHFYGVIEDDNQTVNGVINEIPDIHDWASLMRTEMILGIAPAHNFNYRVVDVTDCIEGVDLPEDAVVHMVANEPQNEQDCKFYPPSKGYYEYVLRGTTKHRSKEFVKRFLDTGGLDRGECIQMRQMW